MLPRVFDLFVQERQALDRSEGGLGLGLSIVRSLVALHGGTVEAHSEGLGRGSEFRVLLPLSAAVDLPAPTGRQSDGNARPDGPTGPGRGRQRRRRRDARASARASGATSFASRTTGLRRSRSWRRSRPTWRCSTSACPAMDGYELARRLRALPALAGIRLVALTGYGQARDRAGRRGGRLPRARGQARHARRTGARAVAPGGGRRAVGLDQFADVRVWARRCSRRPGSPPSTGSSTGWVRTTCSRRSPSTRRCPTSRDRCRQGPAPRNRLPHRRRRPA